MNENLALDLLPLDDTNSFLNYWEFPTSTLASIQTVIHTAAWVSFSKRKQKKWKLTLFFLEILVFVYLL